MKDYARLYRRSYQERKASKQIRQIKRLVRMKLPYDILLILIIAILYPGSVLNSLKD
jgi:hypothetical protein